MSKKRAKCEVTETGIINPCFGLDESIEDDVRDPRVELLSFVDVKTLKTTRNIVSIKSGKHRKRGLVCNYCPFCGTRIYKESSR